MVKAEPEGSSRDLGNSSLALESKSFPTALDDMTDLWSISRFFSRPLRLSVRAYLTVVTR